LDKVTIKGVEYELDSNVAHLTLREARHIHQHTGLMPAQLSDAWYAENPDAHAAMCWLAMSRAGDRIAGKSIRLDQLDFQWGDFSYQFNVEAEQPADPTPAETDSTPTDSAPSSDSPAPSDGTETPSTG